MVNEHVGFLKNLASIGELHQDKPWIPGGDFNMVKSVAGEKGRIHYLVINS